MSAEWIENIQLQDDNAFLIEVLSATQIRLSVRDKLLLYFTTDDGKGRWAYDMDLMTTKRICNSQAKGLGWNLISDEESTGSAFVVEYSINSVTHITYYDLHRLRLAILQQMCYEALPRIKSFIKGSESHFA